MVGSQGADDGVEHGLGLARICPTLRLEADGPEVWVPRDQGDARAVEVDMVTARQVACDGRRSHQPADASDTHCLAADMDWKVRDWSSL